MQFRYSIDFRCGIAVFIDVLRGNAGLGTPQCPPLYSPSFNAAYPTACLAHWEAVEV